jgi:hypothetical protein
MSQALIVVPPVQGGMAGAHVMVWTVVLPSGKYLATCW